jgi:hypothetical protein
LTLNVNAAEQARAFANKNNTASGDCFMQIQTDLKLLASDFIDARVAYTNTAFTIASAPTANTIAISYVGTL